MQFRHRFQLYDQLFFCFYELSNELDKLRLFHELKLDLGYR